MEEVNFSIKLENLAHAYQRASVHLINSYKKTQDLAILIPAIFCSKHAMELYLKALLNELGVSQFHHNQKKLFAILDKELSTKKPFIKKHQKHLDTLKTIVSDYGNNKVGGIFVTLPEDFENTNFRYIKKNVGWVNDLRKIDPFLFQKELKDLKQCAMILCALARMN